jgi:hypothetical protein
MHIVDFSDTPWFQADANAFNTFDAKCVVWIRKREQDIGLSKIFLRMSSGVPSQFGPR